MKREKELRCCLGCGRDTRGDYCPRCIGHSGSSADKGCGRSVRPAADAPLEDDYGEESDADSVCEDNSASVYRAY